MKKRKAGIRDSKITMTTMSSESDPIQCSFRTAGGAVTMGNPEGISLEVVMQGGGAINDSNTLMVTSPMGGSVLRSQEVVRCNFQTIQSTLV
jgi:hypothetical protein